MVLFMVTSGLQTIRDRSETQAGQSAAIPTVQKTETKKSSPKPAVPAPRSLMPRWSRSGRRIRSTDPRLSRPGPGRSPTGKPERSSGATTRPSRSISPARPRSPRPWSSPGWRPSIPSVLNETVTFSERADQTTGSTSGVRAGERLPVRELLYGLLLPSGNDAAVAFGEHFGGRSETRERFAQRGRPLASVHRRNEPPRR